MPVEKKIFWFLAVITILRLAVAGSFELSLDEGYYWLWSKHLDIGYYDHPPMVAYVLALATIFSDSEIFVRLPAVAGALVSSLIIYKLTADLFEDKMAAFSATIIANATLIFSAGALITTTDSPLIPFYVSAMALFYSAVQDEPGQRYSSAKWIAAGALAGCALLSKYTAVFFFPCAFLFLLLSTRNRAWLKKPQPYMAGAVAFLVFTPVIVWNAGRDWASLAFQAKHGLAGIGSSPIELFAEFAGFQVVLYSVGIFFFLVAAGVMIIKNSLKIGSETRLKEASLFLFSFSIPILTFFVLNSFRTRMEGNWPILGFIPLIMQAGGMAGAWNKGPFTRYLFRGSIAIAVLLLAFLHLQIINPVIPHPQRYEISRRVYGWKILGEKVNRAREENGAAFLISNRFQIATLLTYYTNPHINAYLPGKDNARRFYFLPHPDGYTGKNALYLTETKRDYSAKIAQIFERVEEMETIDITRKGELIRQFKLYLCYNYQGGLEGI